MARGTWEDFTSKWGFNDGASCDGIDWQVRDQFCNELNSFDSVKTCGVRFLPFDRPGVHNGCLILVVEDDPGKTDAEIEEAGHLKQLALPDAIPELVECLNDANDPEDVEYNIELMINEIYEYLYYEKYTKNTNPLPSKSISKQGKSKKLTQEEGEAIIDEIADEFDGLDFKARIGVKYV